MCGHGSTHMLDSQGLFTQTLDYISDQMNGMGILVFAMSRFTPSGSNDTKRLVFLNGIKSANGKFTAEFGLNPRI